MTAPAFATLSRLGVMFSVLLVIPAIAHSGMISFVTAPNAATGGQPVSAKVTLTTGTDTVTLLLENLQSNPTSAVQAISGLSFGISTGQNAGTITSSAAIERSIAKNHSFTDAGSVATGWSLSTQGSQLHLDVLGTKVGPAHLLIGPAGGATYASANGSIAGNGPHNPFLAESATFAVHVPGVTSASKISGVTFAFGTTAGANLVVGIPGAGPAVELPEPSSIFLAAFAFIGVCAFARRRRL